MSIEFSEHALRQLRQRKIPKAHVVLTIRNPEARGKSFRNRRLRRRRFGDKMLEVVTVTEGPRITAVTAYYLKEENEN